MELSAGKLWGLRRLHGRMDAPGVGAVELAGPAEVVGAQALAPVWMHQAWGLWSLRGQRRLRGQQALGPAWMHRAWGLRSLQGAAA